MTTFQASVAVGLLFAAQANAAVVVREQPAQGPLLERVRGNVVKVRGTALLGQKRGDSVDVFEVESTGSGVLVERGLVVANLHSVMVFLKDGSRHPVEKVEVTVEGAGTFSATALGADPGLDVVILKLTGLGAGLPGATFAQRSPAPGEALLSVVANARGVVSQMTTVDHVQRGDLGTDQIALTPHLAGRDFGAVLFNQAGELSGFGIPVGDDLCAGLPVENLRLLIERSLPASSAKAHNFNN